MCPHPPPQGPTTRAAAGVAEPTESVVDRIGQAGPVGLLPGTELLGEFRGSGYREPPQLVARADGQLVRLPALLYLVVRLLEQHGRGPEGSRPSDPELLATVARAAAEEADLALGVEHIGFLLDRKLAPLGITTYADGTAPVLAKQTPFLGLRVRAQLLRPAATWVVGGVLEWLFFPLVAAVLVAIAGFVEWWFFTTQNMATAMLQTLLDPAGVLAVIVLALASTLFHECGHAAACRYSGVAPGGMGCGIYLVWPAFYTDITNTYRLGRGGRLRADLGGVYFNAIFLIVLTGAYLATGWAPLLVAVLSVNLEIVQQLLPTLRFDGYYIVADAVGIPDLFRYIGPVLSRHLLRRPADPRLSALKRWPQTVITVWVVLVIPALAAQLGYIAWQLPQLLRTDIDAITLLASNATSDGNPVLGVAFAALRILLLSLPVVGVLAVFWQLARTGWRLIRRYAFRPSRARHRAAGRGGRTRVGAGERQDAGPHQV